MEKNEINKQRKESFWESRVWHEISAAAIIGSFFIGGILAFCGGVGYLGRRLETGSWNIKQQSKIRETRLEKEKREKIDYPIYLNKLFGQNGYADINHDGILSFEEKVIAWQKMGYTNRLYDSARDGPAGDWREGATFPRPTLQELEKAVQSYELNIGEKRNVSFK